MKLATTELPKLAVVLVNWNGWRDTVACLSSLLPTLTPGSKVLVCDNASSDESLSHIGNWAQESTGPESWRSHTRSTAQQGGNVDDPQLILIDTQANLGFAGGNNVGIRYALAQGFDYIWLLNNDTVVDKHAAAELLQRMMADTRIGMCGSTIFYHDRPNTVQCLGGSRFDVRSAVGAPIGFGPKPNPLPSIQEVERQLGHISGASMMVSRPFLEAVGLMEESYFLYFEEIDWAIRAEGMFTLGWAPLSYVWHKEGASIGSSHRSRPSDKSLSFICTNRLKFTRKHVPQHYRSVQCRMWRDALVYAKRRDWSAVVIHLHALLRANSPPESA